MVNINTPKLYSGFTLIELLLTIAITALIVTLANYNSNWIKTASLSQAKSLTEQAVAKARAISLMNPSGLSDAAASASLCLTTATVDNSTRTKLEVRQLSSTPTTNTSVCSESNTIWQTILPANIYIDTGSATGTPLCLAAFNNRGQYNTSGGCLSPDNLPTVTGCLNATSSSTVLPTALLVYYSDTTPPTFGSDSLCVSANLN